LQLHLRPGEFKSARADIERGLSDVQLRLLRRGLHALNNKILPTSRSQSAQLRGTIARTCDDYLRRKYPLTSQLENKVAVTAWPVTRVQPLEDKVHGWFAGLACWESRRADSQFDRAERCELDERRELNCRQ